MKPVPSDNPNAGVPLTDASAVIEAVERLATPRMLFVADPRYPADADGNSAGASFPFVVIPKGHTMSSIKPVLDEYYSRPDRIVGTTLLHDEASFVRQFQRFENPASAVYCNASALPMTFEAVFDHHGRGPVDESKPGESLTAPYAETYAPAFMVHRALWTLKTSRQYDTWRNRDEHWMSHAEFAEFLEQNAVDLYQGSDIGAQTASMLAALELKIATPSQLIALSRNLQVNVNAAVRSAQTLATGEIHMTYAETHENGEGQPVRVPNAFLIAIPIVHRGPAFQVLCRLRYRVTPQGVRWSYAAHRLDIVFDAAVDEIVSRIEGVIGRIVLRGAAPK